MEIDRLVRIALSGEVEPGDRAVAAWRGTAAAAIRNDPGRLRDSADRLRAWRAAGIEVLIPGDAGWPTQVDDLAAPPLVLYTRGQPLRRLLLPSVTVVGSRAATSHGCRVAQDWSRALAAAGCCVVSGAAFGIDAAAHRGALAVGYTVAVLASGVDVASPVAHRDLLARIAACGAVVSELPPGTRPARHRFLARNRLIAALAPVTLVVQAAPRSGASATARRAADLHRVVAAVPGAVGDPAHWGCHDLIRQGIATLVRDPAEVVELVAPIGAAAVELPRG